MCRDISELELIELGPERNHPKTTVEVVDFKTGKKLGKYNLNIAMMKFG